MICLPFCSKPLFNPYSGNCPGHAPLLTCPITDDNPYSANLAGHASVLTCPITEFFKAVALTIAMRRFWSCFNTLIPSHWIEVDIERLFSCQNAQFLRSKNKQNGDQFFYQISDFCENCNPPHVIPPPLVNTWLTFDMQKYVNWLCVFLEVNPCFQRAHVFCMDPQPAVDPYNVVCICTPN